MHYYGNKIHKEINKRCYCENILLCTIIEFVIEVNALLRKKNIRKLIKGVNNCENILLYKINTLYHKGKLLAKFLPFRDGTSISFVNLSNVFVFSVFLDE